MLTIFLDFDGVLHSKPKGSSGGLPFENNSILAKALQGMPVNIVVSSSWRCHFPHDELQDMLNPLNVVEFDVLPCPETDRSQMILDWVQNHKLFKWIAIDDQMLALPLSHFCQTNGAFGFQEKDGQHLKMLIEKMTQY